MTEVEIILAYYILPISAYHLLLPLLVELPAIGLQGAKREVTLVGQI